MGRLCAAALTVLCVWLHGPIMRQHRPLSAAAWTVLDGCIGPNIVRLHGPSLLCGCIGRLIGCIGQFCAAAWTVFIVRLHGPSLLCYYAAAWTDFIARLHGPSLLYYYAAALAVFCGNAWLPLGARTHF